MRLQVTTFLFVAVFIICFKASAQRSETIDALRVGLFTEKMNLNEDQAIRFWPIYNLYLSERRKILQEIRKEKRAAGAPNATDTERLESQEELIELKKKEIELSETFRSKFLTVLSPKQYSQMLLAEEEFNRRLLEELRRRRGERN